MSKINGNTLVQWGFKPGSYFKEAIAVVDQMARDNHFGKTNHSEDDMKAAVAKFMPTPVQIIPLQDGSAVPIHYNIDATTDFEKDNLNKVKAHMNELAKVPTIKALAVQPDGCPSGGNLGTIPVGGVAVAENAIHPGLHSADVCCSVAISIFPDDVDMKSLIDAGMKLSHFGTGGRPYSHDMKPSQDLLDDFERNPFLTNKKGVAEKHFATQGGGNHFYYVGRLESTGQVALVTHHGSRNPGALLYNVGIATAEKMTAKLCPEVNKHNLWIPYDTQEGQDYWAALQIIRRWTKGNHFSIHDAVAKYLSIKVKDRYWNPHNFVFNRTINGKEYFYHAKGSTPNYIGFSPDATNKTLIPLNMASPILICEVNSDQNFGTDFIYDTSLGFCPHGAGRNYSRTEFSKLMTEKGISPKQMIQEVESKFDVRAYSGKHDITEFPLAYKNAEDVTKQIEKYKLTTIVDKVLPYGSIMGGHEGIDYKELKRKKKERREKLDQGF